MIDLWTDLQQGTIVEQQRSELYMRLYHLCAQDFVNNQDMLIFCQTLLAYLQALEERLTELSTRLSSHTHEVPPHTHTVPPHTHLIMPHSHPTAWGPSGPNIPSPTDTGTLVVTNASPTFPTLIPTQDVTWKPVTVPTTYVNTSGTLTNPNNKVMIGTSIHGSALPHQRRSTPDPLSVTPSVPPYLMPNPV